MSGLAKRKRQCDVACAKRGPGGSWFVWYWVPRLGAMASFPARGFAHAAQVVRELRGMWCNRLQSYRAEPLAKPAHKFGRAGLPANRSIPLPREGGRS
jgi:hypothetical protein